MMTLFKRPIILTALILTVAVGVSCSALINKQTETEAQPIESTENKAPNTPGINDIPATSPNDTTEEATIPDTTVPQTETSQTESTESESETDDPQTDTPQTESIESETKTSVVQTDTTTASDKPTSPSGKTTNTLAIYYDSRNGNYVTRWNGLDDLENDSWYELVCKYHYKTKTVQWYTFNNGKLLLYDGALLIYDADSGEITYPDVSKNAVFVASNGAKNLISDDGLYLCELPDGKMTYLGLSGTVQQMNRMNSDVILQADGLSIYNFNSGDLRRLSVPDADYDDVDYITDRLTGEVIGLSLKLTDGEMAYYHLADDRMKTDFVYTMMDSNAYHGAINANVHDVIDDRDHWHSYLFAADTGKAIGDADGYLRAITSGNVVYYTVSDHEMSRWRYDVYNSNMKKLSDEKYADAMVTSEGNVSLIGYVNIEESYDTTPYFTVLDREGNLVLKSRDYDTVKGLIGDYVLIIDNGYLKIVGVDGGERATLCEWNANFSLHTMLSGYKNTLYPLDTKDVFRYDDITLIDGIPVQKEAELPEVYPAGIYVVVEDESIPYGKEGSGMEYVFDPETGHVSVFYTSGVGDYAKPVLYLYPETTGEVSVTFAHPERLTVTYPVYTDGWKVTATPDGTLTDARGRKYYALYWEEDGYAATDFSTGFCVAGSDAASFLEEKLDILGFTEREANEFIMYWLPVMQASPYSLVYFELTDSRQYHSELTITPKPDTLLRVAIHVKGIGAPAAITEQKLPTFVRDGFTAIEWGGVRD